MQPSTLSGMSSPHTSRNGFRTLSLLLILVGIVVLGAWLVFQSPDKLQGQSPERPKMSNAASTSGKVNTATSANVPTATSDQVVWPNDETESAFPYTAPKNASDYQTAIEVQKRIQARDAKVLAERMRMAEAARAAGYPLTDPDFK